MYPKKSTTINPNRTTSTADVCLTNSLRFFLYMRIAYSLRALMIASSGVTIKMAPKLISRLKLSMVIYAHPII